MSFQRLGRLTWSNSPQSFPNTPQPIEAPDGLIWDDLTSGLLARRLPAGGKGMSLERDGGRNERKGRQGPWQIDVRGPGAYEGDDVKSPKAMSRVEKTAAGRAAPQFSHLAREHFYGEAILTLPMVLS